MNPEHKNSIFIAIKISHSFVIVIYSGRKQIFFIHTAEQYIQTIRECRNENSRHFKE